MHFDFKICFGSQRRAIFANRNFQNYSFSEIYFNFKIFFVLQGFGIYLKSTSVPAALAKLLFEYQELPII